MRIDKMYASIICAINRDHRIRIGDTNNWKAMQVYKVKANTKISTPVCNTILWNTKLRQELGGKAIFESQPGNRILENSIKKNIILQN
jgi:hypothetical protein